jgi:ATP-dependent RNA helicase DDX3X
LQVETSGNNVPAPAFSFDELNLGKVLTRNVQFNNYSKPTPVQQYSIPISMAGRDIMACAQTGSGKTAAFTFPILYCLLKRGQPSGSGRRAMPSALALAPTRELAIQIQEESSKFSFRTGLRKLLPHFFQSPGENGRWFCMLACAYAYGETGELVAGGSSC